MSEYNQEYDDYYYDDGGFCDDGGNDERDEFDIPTYDELDLEGRYYTYGSRSDYNAWRNEQIHAIQNASRPKFIPTKNSNNHVRMRHKSDYWCPIKLFFNQKFYH